jgi:hypothetical protein
LRAGSKEQGAKGQELIAGYRLSVFVNGIEQKETKRTKGQAEWSERDERPAANEFQTLKARRRD